MNIAVLRRRFGDPKFVLVIERFDSTGNQPESAARVAPDRANGTVIRAKRQSMFAPLEGGRLHYLKLALPPLAFAARYDLSHAPDRESQAVIAGRGFTGKTFNRRRERARGLRKPFRICRCLRVIDTEIEKRSGCGARRPAERCTSRTEVQPVHRERAEFVPRRGVVISAKHGNA